MTHGGFIVWFCAYELADIDKLRHWRNVQYYFARGGISLTENERIYALGLRPRDERTSLRLDAPWYGLRHN